MPEMPESLARVRMPVVFVSHGSPMVLLDDDDYTRALTRAGAAVPRPRAIVVVSAHFEAAAPIRVTGSPRPQQIFDFGGFPPALYAIEYEPPGDPVLATAITERFAAEGLDARVDDSRGLDHGVWVPLRFMFPAADIPVVAISLPVPRTPATLLATGRALARFRNERVLLVASGGIVHNLAELDWNDPLAPTPVWAREFDDFVRGCVRDHDRLHLSRYRELAPHAARAVPTSEHFDPLFVFLGTLSDDDGISDIHRGFRHGSLSMQTFFGDGATDGSLSPGPSG